MQSTRSPLLAVAFVALAVVCVVLGVLYLLDVVAWFSTDPNSHGPHTKHAIVLAVVAVAALIAANFARPKPA
jgi:hypothetical protein